MVDKEVVVKKLLVREAMLESLDDMATLRLGIFQEYPYLYLGRREDELNYLGRYARVPDACFILAKDGGLTVGAVTGMPLDQEDQHMLDAFSGTDCPSRES